MEIALWLAVQELTARNTELAVLSKDFDERLAALEARLAQGSPQ